MKLSLWREIGPGTGGGSEPSEGGGVTGLDWQCKHFTPTAQDLVDLTCGDWDWRDT